MEIHRLIEEIYEEMVGWRRKLHEEPELSFEEHQTDVYKRQAVSAVVLGRAASSVMRSFIVFRPNTKSAEIQNLSLIHI